MLPFTDQHTFRNGEAVDLTFAPDMIGQSPIAGVWNVKHGGGGKETHMVCGYVESSELLFAPAYAKAFEAVYHHRPDYHNAESTATCLAFQYAIQNAGTLDPEKVRDALSKLDVTTFYGILKFDSRGMNVYKPMVTNQIQNGKLVTVWPAGLAEAKPIYPTPAWGKR